MRSTQELTLSQRKKTPSFSSSLLDAIYRSIDEETISSATSTTTSTTTTTSTAAASDDFSIITHGARTNIKTHETTLVVTSCGKRDEMIKTARRPRLEPIVVEKPRAFGIEKQFLNSASSSSSSDSCSKEGASALFSPSSTTYRAISLPSCFTPVRSKQIRTRNSTRSDDRQSKQNLNPISPGRRISIILNSLFNVKKKRSVADNKSSKSTTTNVAATAIVGKVQSSTTKLHIEQSKQCQKRDRSDRSAMINSDDDVESNASSDLFEIENLIGIGGKYVEELPVYGTTDLKANQAIARGLFV